MASESKPKRLALHQSLVLEFPGRVECLVNYSMRVLVGTSDGRLVLFDTRKDPNRPVSIHELPHKQRIQQILVVPHIRVVIILANNSVTVHSATDLELISSEFHLAKDVTHLCVNQRGPPHFRICAASATKLQLFQFEAKEKKYKYLRELAIADPPEVVAWYRNKLVVGNKRGYCLVNDKTAESIPINLNMGPNTTPAIKLLPNEEIVVSAMDSLGVSLLFTGEPVHRNSISWSKSPSVIEYTSPYLVSMIPNKGVEVHSMQDCTLVQSITLPRITAMFGNGMKWDMEPRAGGDSEDVIIVASLNSTGSTSVYKIEQMPMEQQVQELLDRGRIEEASDLMKKSISSLNADKQKSRMRRFHRQVAIALLKRCEFDSAVEFIYRSGMDPREWLSFFPDLVSPSFAYEPTILTPDVMPRGSSASPDWNSVLAALLRDNSSNLAPELIAAGHSKLYIQSTKALLKSLEMIKKHSSRERSSSRDQAGPFATPPRSRSTSRENEFAASHSSISHRSFSRASSISGPSSFPKDIQRSEAVDTALLRLYVTHEMIPEIASLLMTVDYQGDGAHCDVGSSQALLLQHSLYYELGLLFERHGRILDALDVYARMGSGEYVQNELEDSTSGVMATIDLLQTIDDIPLVLFHSKWVLQVAPHEAVRIFTHRQKNLKQLVSDDIVNHLKEHSSDPGVVQKYLESLIDGDGPTSSSAISEVENPHHTRLAVEYLDEVLQAIQSSNIEPSRISPGKEASPLGEARKRLLKYLKAKESAYDVGALMSKVKSTPGLQAELLILCGRGGFHEDALRALLAENAIMEAETYSIKYGSKGSSSNRAMLKLLELLFKDKDGDRVDFAFQLLGRHAKSLNGTAVLNMIPASTPLVKVMDFLNQLLPHSTHEVREKTLARNLSNIYNLQVQCERVEKLSESVEIDPKTPCGVCRKRIDTNIFAVYPNGSIVHFACGPNVNMEMDPVTDSYDMIPATGESTNELKSKSQFAMLNSTTGPLAVITESKDEDQETIQNGRSFEDRDRIEKQKQNHFEKLNTLKLLLDTGHLTQDEYIERKNQIINEMTGTNTDRIHRNKPKILQPIMKTVVPHNPPDFAHVMKERAEKLTFDADTLEWNSSHTVVKLDLVPFATGQLRNAYFLQELGSHGDAEPKLFVAKVIINDADPSAYLCDVEMQAVCAHYAKLYNQHEPPLKVKYAGSWLLKLRDRQDLVCSVEEYLPGAYVKYSNNNGFVGRETSTTEERERNTPQAFSHFTFVSSDYRLMVVDIQGVNDSYTDPQIHTADGRGFGVGNMGTLGMEKFLESHRCNEVCRWLGLRSLNEQFKPGGTAAPLYRMPHDAVMKSTSRITEERNTFSRSVTVSEVLGTRTQISEASLLLNKPPPPKAFLSIFWSFLCFMCCCPSSRDRD